jgi:hypothetical protein
MARRHDGKVANTYATKESAFEAVAAAASLALRQGHEIMITAPGSDDGRQRTSGAREWRLLVRLLQYGAIAETAEGCSSERARVIAGTT